MAEMVALCTGTGGAGVQFPAGTVTDLCDSRVNLTAGFTTDGKLSFFTPLSPPSGTVPLLITPRPCKKVKTIVSV